MIHHSFSSGYGGAWVSFSLIFHVRARQRALQCVCVRFVCTNVCLGELWGGVSSLVQPGIGSERDANQFFFVLSNKIVKMGGGAGGVESRSRLSLFGTKLRNKNDLCTLEGGRGSGDAFCFCTKIYFFHFWLIVLIEFFLHVFTSKKSLWGGCEYVLGGYETNKGSKIKN